MHRALAGNEFLFVAVASEYGWSNLVGSTSPYRSHRAAPCANLSAHPNGLNRASRHRRTGVEEAGSGIAKSPKKRSRPLSDSGPLVRPPDEPTPTEFMMAHNPR